MSSSKPYSFAQEQFPSVGVDTEAASEQLNRIPVSVHCWQADDVAGLEAPETAGAGNGCLATANYPGKARNLHYSAEGYDVLGKPFAKAAIELVRD